MRWGWGGPGDEWMTSVPVADQSCWPYDGPGGADVCRCSGIFSGLLQSFSADRESHGSSRTFQSSPGPSGLFSQALLFLPSGSGSWSPSLPGSRLPRPFAEPALRGSVSGPPGRKLRPGWPRGHVCGPRAPTVRPALVTPAAHSPALGPGTSRTQWGRKSWSPEPGPSCS